MRHQFFQVGKFLLFIMCLISQSALASDIIIDGKTVINTNTHYSNCRLNFVKGYFQVIKNARLEITNCVIKGNISRNNAHLFDVVSGQLILKNNKISITSVDIPKNPNTILPYHVISMSHGKLYLVNNKLTVDKPYTVGLLTTANLYTIGFNIVNNTIHNFHSGLILVNSHNAYVAKNRFSNVSLGNILIMNSSYASIKENNIFFPGSHVVGDGIDIINSRSVKIENNNIYSGGCYSIAILGADDVLLSHNRVMSGITYAITIQDPLVATSMYQYMKKYSKSLMPNNNIVITNNYFSQNRYGVTAINVNRLHVENNIFIQRFANATLRKFWTNNAILMQRVQTLVWKNNLYKEAYTQIMGQVDQNTSKFVEFPVTGGVSL